MAGWVYGKALILRTKTSLYRIAEKLVKLVDWRTQVWLMLHNKQGGWLIEDLGFLSTFDKFLHPNHLARRIHLRPDTKPLVRRPAGLAAYVRGNFAL